MIFELLANEPLVGFFLGLLPQQLIGVIMIFFNFYIELVNFQLKNLVQIVLTAVGCENNSSNNPIDFETMSKVAKCFKIICEMADTVNNILRRTVLTVFLILVVITITLIYENLALLFQGIVIPNKHFRMYLKFIANRFLTIFFEDACAIFVVNFMLIIETVHNCQKSLDYVCWLFW